MSIDFNESKILRIPEFNDDEGIELSDFPDIYFGDFVDEFFKKDSCQREKTFSDY